jgi:hypothetical protein
MDPRASPEVGAVSGPLLMYAYKEKIRQSPPSVEPHLGKGWAGAGQPPMRGIPKATRPAAPSAIDPNQTYLARVSAETAPRAIAT